MKHWVLKTKQEAPATLLLCVALIAVYIITAAQSRSLIHNLDDSALSDAWVLYLPAMTNNGAWGTLRAVGTAFLHIGPVHLAMNSIVLFLFGRELEQALGSAGLIMSFLAGAVGASAIIVWMDPQAATAGASGALFALIVQYLVVAMQQRRELGGLVALILVNIGFTLLWSDWVSVWGHLGGAGVGIMLAMITALVRPNRGRLVAYFLLCAMGFCGVFWRVWQLSTGTAIFAVLSTSTL